MSFKRGTPVTFVGPVGDGPCSKGEEPFLSKKYGVSIGDKGKVGYSKGGWTRVTWTRSDGSSAVSVPMRPCWIKEGHHEVIKPPPEIKQQAEEDEKEATLNSTTYNTESDPFEEAIKNGDEFVPYGSADYKGHRTGYTFGTKWPGPPLGTGYYLDTRKALLTQLRAAEKANTRLRKAMSLDRYRGLNKKISELEEKKDLLQQLDRALRSVQ